jgi:hypothetical protein
MASSRIKKVRRNISANLDEENCHARVRNFVEEMLTTETAAA